MTIYTEPSDWREAIEGMRKGAKAMKRVTSKGWYQDHSTDAEIIREWYGEDYVVMVGEQKSRTLPYCSACPLSGKIKRHNGLVNADLDGVVSGRDGNLYITS